MTSQNTSLPAWIRPVLMMLGVVVSLGFALLVVLCPREWAVWYLSDDAYYYFSVARHIAAGDGLTADGLTTTTGVHPLYLFLLAGLHKLVGTDPGNLASLDRFVRSTVIMNAAFFWLAGYGIYQVGRLWRDRNAGRWFLVLWLTNGPAVLLAVIGLEGAVYCAALAWLIAAMLALVRRPDRAWPGLAVGALLAVVVLARIDAVIYVPIVILWTVWQGNARMFRRFGRLVLMLAAPAAALALWLAWGYHETGLFGSGSGAIKQLWRAEYAGDTIGAEVLFTAALFGKWCMKCLFKVPMLKYVLVAVLIVKLRWLETWQKRFLLAVTAIPLAIGLAIAGMLHRDQTWYYAPALVALTIVAGCLWSVTLDRLALANASRVLVRLAGVAVLVAGIEGAAYAVFKAVVGRSPKQQGGLQTAIWIREHLPADAIIGDWDSGIRSFYSNRVVVNLDGLANNDILKIHAGQLTMPDYWRERGIGYIVYNRDDIAKFADVLGDQCLQPVHGVIWKVRSGE